MDIEVSKSFLLAFNLMLLALVGFLLGLISSRDHRIKSLVMRLDDLYEKKVFGHIWTPKYSYEFNKKNGGSESDNLWSFDLGPARTEDNDHKVQKNLYLEPTLNLVIEYAPNQENGGAA